MAHGRFGPAARRAVVVGVALAALALGACREAAERVFTQPTRTGPTVRVGTIGITGGSLDVVTVVHNPNPYGLTARRASYRLMVRDSVEVGNGIVTEEFSVRARDSVEVILPLDVNWGGLRAAMREATGDGTVDYRLAGDVVMDTPIGDRTFPFDQRGRMSADVLRRRR